MLKYFVRLQALVASLLIVMPAMAQMDEDCEAHPDDDIMHTEHCAVMAIVPEEMATHVTVANGSWFNPAIWNTGTVPNAGARVLVDSGFTVTYDAVSETEIDWLRVNGTLQFSTTLNTKLKLTTCVVDPIGIMSIGTALTPIGSDVSAQLMFTDNGPIDITMDPFEFGKGLVSHGMFTVYGAYKKPICALNKNVLAGAASLKLGETPSGWKIGDQIVVPGTYGTYIGDFASNTKFHDEVLTITSISGKTVFFTNNATGGTTLQYDHKIPAGYGLKMYVANLTRNVTISSENHLVIPIDQRGHVMLMHNVNQQVAYASWIGLGRTNKDILATDPIVSDIGEQLGGGSNVRGRYGIHIHRAGANDIDGIPVVILGNAVVDPTSWGIVNHQSHVNTDNNVVFNYFGAAFVTEDGNELGRFTGNMAIKGRKATTVTDINARTANFDFGYEGNGFWLQSSNVSYENNISTSCIGDAYKVFSDDASLPATKRFKIPKENILHPEIAGEDDSIYTGVVPLRLFANNIAYNCYAGMAFWTHMYNNDNVGDFSTMEMDGYTHTLMSVVENCKFWNMLGEGITVKYSGQVHFKNVTLLGDVNTQFASSDWISGNPVGGYGFITSTVTGQIWYENLTVKGWKRAIVAGRADDLVSADGIEYDYRTSQVIGGTYANNTYNIFPEEGTDLYGGPEYYRFPNQFVISGSPTFSVITANVLPVADYAYASDGGTAIQFDGGLSSDADPGVITAGQGNGIAAYVWQFGDGTTGYGKNITHHYTTAGTKSVQLTVYDSQGKTGAVTKNVYVADVPYENVVLHSGFETDGLTMGGYMNSSRAFIDNGWFYKSNWQIVDGKALIYSSDKWSRPLAQVIKNDKALQGPVEFSFQAKNLGPGAIGNDLICEIVGINGEFYDHDFINSGTVVPWNNNALPFDADILYNANVGLANFNWQTFTHTVNFGEGYTYILVKFYSEGIKVGPAEEQGIDNVCLPCICSVPGGLMEDELSSNHAMLIWDNVGSMNYEVQYKQTGGGSWTTASMNNTYLELSSLTPNTSYTWKVRVQCGGTWTSYSPEKVFITPATGTTCTSPSVLSTELITSNKATLVWNSIPGAVQYQVQWKPVSGATWTTVNTASTQTLLTGLLPATAYQWKVKTQCAAGWKDFTDVITFTTVSMREGEVADDQSEVVQLTPNPVSDEVTCTVYGNGKPGIVKLVNMQGQSVLQEIIPAQEGNYYFNWSVSGLPDGFYIVSVQWSDGSVTAEKLIVQ